MAQDVLALYATRESLSRPPCNPNIEGQVKDFEAQGIEYEEDRMIQNARGAVEAAKTMQWLKDNVKLTELPPLERPA